MGFLINLIYFLLGIGFIAYIYPTLDALFSLFLSWIGLRQEKIKLKQTELALQTQKMVEELTQDTSTSNVIGFTSINNQEYEEEEDEI